MYSKEVRWKKRRKKRRKYRKDGKTARKEEEKNCRESIAGCCSGKNE